MSVLMLLGVALLVPGGVDEPVPMAVDVASDWRFRADPENQGMALQWYAPSYPDEDWALVRAGARWEDQGFPEVDGYAWYRRRVLIPPSWQGQSAWLVFGAANDTCVVFCNGHRVNSYGDIERKRSMADTAILADLTERIQFGESNLIAVQFLISGQAAACGDSPVR